MIELSSRKKRNEILAEPELLRIDIGPTSGVKTPKAMYLLPFLAYIAVYAYVVHYVFQTISNLSPDKSNYIFSFIVITLVFVSFAGFIIIASSKKPLIFTKVGMVGKALIAIKYEQLDGYNWEKSTEFGNTKKSLALLPKGVFNEMNYRDKFGNSILETYGYYFDSSQIKTAEEIFEKAGVVKVNTRRSEQR